MTGLTVYFLSCAVLLSGVNGRVVNSTESPKTQPSDGSAPGIKPSSSSGARRKRFISQSDMVAILDYHNQVRASVFPPAANMEYMVWDYDLARTAEAWAATCLWEHGPAYLLQFYGQNLSVRTGGYQSILQMVKPWHDEVNDYVFPYPRFCNPSCPLLCYGPMCTHYTQMVWASTNRVGCAVQTCYNMFVWGVLWREATFLVCNYSPNIQNQLQQLKLVINPFSLPTRQIPTLGQCPSTCDNDAPRHPLVSV
ncbi:peptidase inhibitor 15-like isoform X2 [Cebidichthys violaceus]|uniref:peptidase inhibitor 15-like isoform X2 n=1 Tax=Cebidichthys violaceus TaxID=271503 RepID=UPI0035CC046E